MLHILWLPRFNYDKVLVDTGFCKKQWSENVTYKTHSLEWMPAKKELKFIL